MFFLFRFGFVPNPQTVQLFQKAFHWSKNIYRYVDECKIRLKQIRHKFEQEIEGRVKELKSKISQTIARVAKLHRFGANPNANANLNPNSNLTLTKSV